MDASMVEHALALVEDMALDRFQAGESRLVYVTPHLASIELIGGDGDARSEPHVAYVVHVVPHVAPGLFAREARPLVPHSWTLRMHQGRAELMAMDDMQTCGDCPACRQIQAEMLEDESDTPPLYAGMQPETNVYA
jgi:hypothetical protein